MSDTTAIVDTYLAAWNETDRTKRIALIEEAWTIDGQLVDPPAAGEGHAGISELAAGLHAQFPGHQFRRSSGIDIHHGAFRFAWELVAPDGTVALAGLDVGEFADDGRLRRITGFFGELPPNVRYAPTGTRTPTTEAEE
jgi:SnoaL-like domain